MSHANYRKLKNQPLLFVLAEFRFPVIMLIEKSIPEIQERLRHKLPHYETQLAQEFKVQPQGIEVLNSTQWAFIDQARQNAIILSQNRLVCVTSNYDRFTGFKEFFLEALKVLHEVVQPSFIERIGLRYTDLVISQNKDSDITKYVKPSFYHSEFQPDIGSLDRRANEFILKTTEGVMIIRSLYGHHNLSVLQDVSSLPVKLATHDYESKRIILDFDHIWEAKDVEDHLSFEQHTIADKLDKMHIVLRAAFWESVTTEGITAWEQ